MKHRYTVMMNDGEIRCSFTQLKDAKKYVSEHWHDYISRYHIIYDNKKRQYIH